MSKLFVDHVLWIEQSKFNANIWAFHNIDVDRLLKPWVLHLAGGHKKSIVFNWLLSYKTMMNDDTISQDAKTKQAEFVQRRINHEIQSNTKLWKVKQLVNSGTTYDNYMAKRDRFTDQNAKNSQC